ncbi:hypothetical protein KP509_03G071000 [Ceratopteris richardii]|uniref:Uncharacterized protein n=1 Tax=Ceratopteris richardii TaxID=49495 RepID=A0A8T2V7Z2_CERRI|nr:hypothetical protein KP509_03G071000 [Ceratopteris richardii]
MASRLMNSLKDKNDELHPKKISFSLHSRVIELSGIDQIAQRVYTSILFFYAGHEPVLEASQLLKGSLSQAGRFREKINGELEIVCNDEGASFFEAWVDCGFDRFLPGFECSPDFNILGPPLDASTDITSIPLLLAQIIHFECGHVCLGVRLHHQVCDGCSASQFLSPWARLARRSIEMASNDGDSKEEMASNDGDSKVDVKVHHDRSLLRANNPPSPTNEHPEYQTHKRELPTSRPPCVSKIFSFTPSSIDDLRRQASSKCWSKSLPI